MSKQRSVVTMSVKSVLPRGDRAVLSSDFSGDSRQSNLAEKRGRNSKTAIKKFKKSTLQSHNKSEPDSGSIETNNFNKIKVNHGSRAHGLSLRSSDEDSGSEPAEVQQSKASKERIGVKRKAKGGKLIGCDGGEDLEPPAARQTDGVDEEGEGIPLDHPDAGDRNNNVYGVPFLGIRNLGSAILSCLVDKDGEGYRNLANAHQNRRVSIKMSSPTISSIYPHELNWTQLFPGVHVCINFNSGAVKAGYLRLYPKTVKPLEKSGSAHVCMSVMCGKVRVKPGSFGVTAHGKPHLSSVVLFEGCCANISRGTIYSIENWETEEASLHFTVVR